MANVLDGFRISTTAQGGQARGPPCSQSTYWARIPSLGHIARPSHRRRGQGAEDQPTPKQDFEKLGEKELGAAIFIAHSILATGPKATAVISLLPFVKWGNWESKPRLKITQLRRAFANSCLWYSKAHASLLRGWSLDHHITWELVRNTDSQAATQTYWMWVCI